MWTFENNSKDEFLDGLSPRHWHLYVRAIDDASDDVVFRKIDEKKRKRG